MNCLSKKLIHSNLKVFKLKYLCMIKYKSKLLTKDVEK